MYKTTFKIVFGPCCKLMYENFPFPLKTIMKMIMYYGLFKPKFQYKEFPHILTIHILKVTMERSHKNYQQL